MNRPRVRSRFRKACAISNWSNGERGRRSAMKTVLSKLAWLVVLCGSVGWSQPEAVAQPPASKGTYLAQVAAPESARPAARRRNRDFQSAAGQEKIGQK